MSLSAGRLKSNLVVGGLWQFLPLPFCGVSMQSRSARPKGLFILDSNAYAMVYEPHARSLIERYVDIIAPPMTAAQVCKQRQHLHDAEVIFSGWGCPRMDCNFLAVAPNLTAVFYGAGAINSWATRELFDRGVIVTTASNANSIPVAEYTLSTILFSLKNGWQLARETRARKTFVPRDSAPGNYRSTIGLIGLGSIARLLLKLLSAFQLNILAYDPYCREEDALNLGVTLVDLETLFRESDVVSLHAPEIPETFHMVQGSHIRSMKPGSTLINTARGSLINEAEMIDVLCERLDLQAVLDVTEPEPPAADSPLYTLPNVVLTPHIAGSVGHECARMGQYMVDELLRYLRSEPLQWQVKGDVSACSIHRISKKPAADALQLSTKDMVA